MSEADGASTALEPAAAAVSTRIALMDDDEIRRTYRIAEALHASGAYKDVKRAETAFAKMLIGRDLGLSPAQSMGGIHLVEGGVQMHYAMLGQFVRGREGYDYRAGWLKEEPLIDALDRRGREPTEEEMSRVVAGAVSPVVVWHDEEDAADLRPIIGAVVEFTVGGVKRGISRFTLDDAQKANLIKSSDKAAWNTAPRNMLLARAMSNGVKWFVPEVLGGLPVYTEGELPERRSLTAGGDDPEPEGIDLGPAVEKIIDRATELGHRGLSNRMAIEVALGRRSPAVVADWCERARAELDRFAAEKAEAAAAEGATDGTVAEQPVAEPEEVVTAEPVAEADTEGAGTDNDEAAVAAGEGS